MKTEQDSMIELQSVARKILHQAEKKGFVVIRDIRAELARHGESEMRWKEVTELLRESLNYRNGRFYYIVAKSPALDQQRADQVKVRATLAAFLDQVHSSASIHERRGEDRVTFLRPIKLFIDDVHEVMALGRDLSCSGIRFVANQAFLGKKILVELPQPVEGEDPIRIWVRIVWTATAGEGLFENGGAFLGLAESSFCSAK